MRDDTYLAGALGAAVHRPLIFVLVHNAVVDADSALAPHLIFQQHALLRLWRREGEREGKKGLIGAKDGKLSRCQRSSTNESLTDTVIKTLLDSSEAVQKQPTANQHICVFRWVSLGFGHRLLFQRQVVTNAGYFNWKQRERWREGETVAEGSPWWSSPL